MICIFSFLIKSEERKFFLYQFSFCGEESMLIEKCVRNVRFKCVSLGSEEGSLPPLVIMFKTSSARVIMVDHVNR